MKKFKAETMDLQSLSEVRGGTTTTTVGEINIKVTQRKAEVMAGPDIEIEVSADVVFEF